jgi:hypothetical protein
VLVPSLERKHPSDAAPQNASLSCSAPFIRSSSMNDKPTDRNEPTAVQDPSRHAGGQKPDDQPPGTNVPAPDQPATSGGSDADRDIPKQAGDSP